MPLDKVIRGIKIKKEDEIPAFECEYIYLKRKY